MTDLLIALTYAAQATGYTLLVLGLLLGLAQATRPTEDGEDW